jgi:hypothetical protein
MRIVEEFNGHVQARACAPGSKQNCKPGNKKEDDASPTVATDITMFMSTINT